ncbi:MAG TPA: aconitate hydratase [Burkholderiales bacterium]|nr:aconitate hydratase [Burkholderiales bacterium]
MPAMHSFSAAGRSYRYVSVSGALEPAVFERLPFALKIFAENVLRRGGAKGDELLRTIVERQRGVDLPYFPARVVLQDLLGTPALVDLAGLRDAVAEAGGDPAQVNPQVPVQLVIDHSVSVEHAGRGDALERNAQIERERNAERFEFLEWARAAFNNVDIVPTGQGILHQINLERFSPVVMTQERGGESWAYPDTLVGTDSHTTMINALGVLGWGVGGIEAEAVMLGRPIHLRLPEIVGVKLVGAPQPGILATDVVLALTERLRAEGVVGAIVEFHGPGVGALSLADRATIANMSPEFGSTAALFPIDEKTIEYLKLTGRPAAQCELVEAYARAQGLWADAVETAVYDRAIAFDLSTVRRAIAGPRDPHQLLPLAEEQTSSLPPASLEEGSVVIAAITSCTNTSNPRAMIAAGLLARNARQRGLQRSHWVKTSLSPGSRTVLSYLQSADLYRPLQELGFDVVGFGCMTCNGMSGPLPAAVDAEVRQRKLGVTAVLSGNRNFDGRIHPLVREAYIASPPLVVAYAIAGTAKCNIAGDALGVDAEGRPVYLRDVWPSDAEIEAVLREHVRPEQFAQAYERIESAAKATRSVPARFPWNPASTYIKRPPYWEAQSDAWKLKDLRALAILGDNITTDHISPSGAILADSAAGRFLLAAGVTEHDFNSYGTRRGIHEVGVRATFANIRLRNEMVPEMEGSYTRVEPDRTIVPLFDAAQLYVDRQQALVIIAGRNYGCGSSRDWAAKGPRLLGVSAIIAESFERIHRANLAGMGVLPLQFEPGTTRHTLKLDGSETFDIGDVTSGLGPRGTLQLNITRGDGRTLSVPVTCRLDTYEEIAYFKAGGLLPLMRNQLLKAA